MAKHSHSFSVATHSYFRVANQAQQRRLFLADPDYQPVFTYGKLMDEALVEARLLGMTSLADTHNNRTSLQLVLKSIYLQDHPSGKAVNEFRTLNKELFGEPKKEYLENILARVYQKVTPATEELWQYINVMLPGDYGQPPKITPDSSTFSRYKQYFSKYLSTHKVSFESARPLPSLLRQALEATGLTKHGWKFVERDDAASAYVQHFNKTVYVGRFYTPRTRGGAARIVVHEVYGHALRGYQGSVAEGEGFAILLEQLLEDQFKFRRSSRYLAAGLGWGSLGAPMTMREVHEIIWRVMAIIGPYNKRQAKEYAFNECVRVFRGGMPTVAGAVYLKDSVYFEANVAMWRELENKMLEYNEFVDLIEGRRRILS